MPAPWFRYSDIACAKAAAQKLFPRDRKSGESFLTSLRFPLTELEESLQKGVPFVYPYAPSHVPVIFKESDWTTLGAGQKKGYSNLVDLLVNDPAVARLYWGLTKNDSETRVALLPLARTQKVAPLCRHPLISTEATSAFAPASDCPRGSLDPNLVERLGRRKPGNPGEFVPRLLGQGQRLLAAYFGCLVPRQPSQREHLTEGTRLKRFYEDLRETILSPQRPGVSSARPPTFWSCLTRVQWEQNGEPYIPWKSRSLETDPRQKIDSKTIH